MESNSLASGAHNTNPRTRLHKESIRSGYILWLRKSVNEDDLALADAAGLQTRALNHPAVVVDILKKDPEHVRICLMTSCGDQNIIMSKIERESWQYYLPVQPTPNHLPIEPLCLENNMQLRKLSYINTRHTYRVSLVLLKKYDDLEEISSHRLTPESLKTLKRACVRASSLKTKSRRPMTETLPTIPPITPLPSSEQHVYYHPQAAPAQYNVEGNTRPFRVLADEQAPLLPVPVTSRMQNTPAQLPPAWQPQHQTHHSPATTNSYRVHRRPDKPNDRPVLNALLTCLGLCAGVMLLAGLGYSLFLGITWVVHVLRTLMTAIGAELVRLRHYLVHIAGVVASSFITAGKAISTGWKNMVHVLNEIVR